MLGKRVIKFERLKFYVDKTGFCRLGHKLDVKIRPVFADSVTDGHVHTKVWIRNAIHMHCKNYVRSEKLWQPAQCYVFQ